MPEQEAALCSTKNHRSVTVPEQQPSSTNASWSALAIHSRVRYRYADQGVSLEGELGLDEPIKDRNGAEAMARRRIALVFTDVVGSSAAKRAAALGPDDNARDRAYLEGIQTKHLRLIRGAVAEYNGKEIMTIGDSFFLTFEDPVDAIRCAAAIQQRLFAQPIDTPSGPMRLSIGIHVGTPEYFENSWHGTDVDTAARAQSVGSVQQIVVTDAGRKAIGEPLDITFRPLGTFALKGIGDVRLWMLIMAGTNCAGQLSFLKNNAAADGLPSTWRQPLQSSLWRPVWAGAGTRTGRPLSWLTRQNNPLL
jgi:class 3 adenylate cyclase